MSTMMGAHIWKRTIRILWQIYYPGKGCDVLYSRGVWCFLLKQSNDERKEPFRESNIYLEQGTVYLDGYKHLHALASARRSVMGADDTWVLLPSCFWVASDFAMFSVYANRKLYDTVSTIQVLIASFMIVLITGGITLLISARESDFCSYDGEFLGLSILQLLSFPPTILFTLLPKKPV